MSEASDLLDVRCPPEAAVPRRRVVVLHAYDARNRGDGLLVDETLLFLRRIGFRADETYLVALDAASFGTDATLVQYPGMQRAGLTRFAFLGAHAVGGFTTSRVLRTTEIGRLVSGADAVVGVGGAYLQARGPRRSAIVAATHLSQLALAARSACPSFYLPQSVGPLTGPVGRRIRRLLRDVDVLALRDDRSVAELADLSPLRCPDLGVLAVGRSWPLIRRRVGGVRVVALARPLPDEPGFDRRLVTLGQLVGADWASHSTAPGQDDRAYYRHLGLDGQRGSCDALADPAYGACVAVRLHGAIQSILAGLPAIHLAYERKGFGAYRDLGLSEWVHAAGSFDPTVVAAQVRELQVDPSRYWDQIGRATPALRAAESRLAQAVSATFARR